MPDNVQINGQTYALSSLSDDAREILIQIRTADRRLRQLKADIDMITLARRVYIQALTEKLPRLPDSHAVVN